MTILRYGSTGPEVGIFQIKCNKSGVSKLALGVDLAVDDSFGEKTLAVTHYLQSHNGLIDDGLVGDNTQAKLAELLGGVVVLPSDFTYGIDLYHGDSISNLDAFLASKFQFVMHKVTESNNYVDKLFTSRRKALVDGGKLFGAYMFIHYGASAQSQVDLALKTMGKLQDYELPIAIDWELDDGTSNSKMNDVVEEMVAILKSATGRKPFIYSSTGQLSGYSPKAGFAVLPLWVADLRQGDAPRVPKPWNNYTFWQYSFSASVPGIGNPCDVNKFSGSLDDLKKFIKG